MPQSVDFMMEEGADVLDQLASTASGRLRRPWCTFLSCVMLAVLLFAAPSTIVSGADTTLRRVRRQASLFRPPPPPPPPSLPSPPHSPPPPPPLPLPPPPQAEARVVDAMGAADPGGAARVPESSPLIQGIIEAGFSREQAREGLAAVAAKTSADNAKVHSAAADPHAHPHLTLTLPPPPASPSPYERHLHPHTKPHTQPIAHQVIDWLLKRDLERCATTRRTLALPRTRSAPALHPLCTRSSPALPLCTLRSKAEAAAEREAHSYEKIDFDG